MIMEILRMSLWIIREGYVEQMLRYSKDYSPLPSVNN